VHEFDQVELFCEKISRFNQQFLPLSSSKAASEKEEKGALATYLLTLGEVPDHLRLKRFSFDFSHRTLDRVCFLKLMCLVTFCLVPTG